MVWRIHYGFVVAACVRMLITSFMGGAYGHSLWFLNTLTLGLAIWLNKRPPPQLQWPYHLLLWGSSCQCEALRDMTLLRPDTGSNHTYHEIAVNGVNWIAHVQARDLM